MKRKLLYLLLVLTANMAFAKENKPGITNGLDYARNSKPAFEQNKGQVTGEDASHVKYFFKKGNMAFYLLDNGISYQFTKRSYVNASDCNSPEDMIKTHGKSGETNTETYRIDMILQGINPRALITAENPEACKINYNNKNITDINRYSKITYHNIYPNIDWVIYANGTNVEYDFIIRPNGNPNQIKFKNKWAEDMKLNEDGSLTMSCRMGSITEKMPISYQDGKSIGTKMVLKEDTLSFKLEAYNPKSTLRLDPAIYWSTYFGGDSDDYGTACAVDSSDNVYLTGYTWSGTGIALGGYQNGNAGGYDAFLAKFNSNGVLLWATYYGGDNEDKGKSCAVDAMGNVYIAGETYSANLASLSAHQTALAGYNDAFLVKFDSDGNRIWATYYGGGYYDEGYSCAVDASGNVYLAGYAWSDSGIATAGAHQQSIGGGTDAFLVKFNSDGVRQWGTYYGGELWESGYCTTDVTGNVYLAGFTSSTVNIATISAHQTTLGWGDDAYLVKFNTDGVRQWGTYYGGGDYDWGYFIATDSQGNVYLEGHTGSDDVIATSGTQQPTRGGDYDAFLVKFDGNGSRIWGTYYGGAAQERGNACAVDSNDNVILTGYTNSNSTNIISAGAYQDFYGGNQDAFAAKFDSNGDRIWGTYLGGTGEDSGSFCTADSSGNVYLAGYTGSGTDISTTESYQNYLRGNIDSFLTKLNSNGTLNVQDIKSESIKLYPNPVGNFIAINNPENIKIIKADIFDLNGRSVISSDEFHDDRMEVSQLAQGTYIVRIQTENGTERLKFIKE